MNLNKIGHKTETEGLIVSISENCELLIKQTNRKPQETLEFKLSKPRVTSSLKPSFILGLDTKWTIGLSSLEVYFSLFNIKEETIKIELYSYSFDESSFTELKDEVAEIFGFSEVTPKLLQQDVVGSRIFKEFEKLRSEKSSTDVYRIFFLGYARTPSRHFECYLRFLLGLDEKKCSLDFKNLFHNLSATKNLQAFTELKIFQDPLTQWQITKGLYKRNMMICMQTKPILIRFGLTFGTSTFDEKSLFQNYIRYHSPL